MPSRERPVAVAERAARAGGERLRDESLAGDAEAEFGAADLEAAVDRQTSRSLVAALDA